jgi:hypothetical protein
MCGMQSVPRVDLPAHSDLPRGGRDELRRNRHASRIIQTVYERLNDHDVGSLAVFEAEDVARPGPSSGGWKA